MILDSGLLFGPPCRSVLADKWNFSLKFEADSSLLIQVTAMYPTIVYTTSVRLLFLENNIDCFYLCVGLLSFCTEFLV